jgi:hypothetical protein
MNEYEIVIEHIQQVATIAKRFGIADKPEVLEYLTLVQLQAVKRDRTRIIDSKIQEVEGEMKRLDGELEIIDEAKYEAKHIELENQVMPPLRRPKLRRKVPKAPKETLGEAKTEEKIDSKDVAYLAKIVKKGENLLKAYTKADPSKGEGARARVNAAIKIDKLLTLIKEQYYTETSEGEIDERTKEKAEETYGRLSALKIKMLA